MNLRHSMRLLLPDMLGPTSTFLGRSSSSISLRLRKFLAFIRFSMVQKLSPGQARHSFAPHLKSRGRESARSGGSGSHCCLALTVPQPYPGPGKEHFCEMRQRMAKRLPDRVGGPQPEPTGEMTANPGVTSGKVQTAAWRHCEPPFHLGVFADNHD